jgi:hypothetical protein
MSNATKVSEREPRQLGSTGASKRPGGPIGHVGTDTSNTPPGPADEAADDAAYQLYGPVARALRFGSSPLSWWKTLPADGFHAGEQLVVSSALDEIAMVLCGSDIEPALLGDPDSAIALTFSLMPVKRVTLKVDIAMTAVLRCALDGDLKAALVLAHVVDRAELDLALARELCASWFERYLRFSPSRGGFTAGETSLMKALHKLDRARSHGEEARA